MYHSHIRSIAVEEDAPFVLLVDGVYAFFYFLKLILNAAVTLSGRAPRRGPVTS